MRFLVGFLCLVLNGCVGQLNTDKLVVAARDGDLVLCEHLIKKGIDIDSRGMHGTTPIMAAAEGENLDIVDFLLSKGADPNSHNKSGSALMWGVESGNAKIISRLLLAGADPSWRNSQEQTALDLAKIKNKQTIISLLINAMN